jgi:hypothetical protein
MAKIESWKQELDRKYNALMNMGRTDLMDKANEVVCDAIDKLDKIKASIDKEGGVNV